MEDISKNYIMKINLPNSKNKTKSIVISIFVIFSLIAIILKTYGGSNAIKASSITTVIAKKGALNVYVKANGKFISAYEKLLSSPISGVVSEILVRPGMDVNESTVVLKLENPELRQALKNINSEIVLAESQRSAFYYKQLNEKLQLESELSADQSRIELAELENQAFTKLFETGVVSGLEAKKKRLELSQAKNAFSIKKEVFEQFIQMQGYQLAEFDTKISVLVNKKDGIAKDIKSLEYKAQMSGTLHLLDVEVGESIVRGQYLGKVGSKEVLIAKLKLPQFAVDSIKLESPVLISTSNGKITTTLTRIESLVANGTVLGETDIIHPTNFNARPSMVISAEVFVQRHENVVIVPSYPTIVANSTQELYVKTDDLIAELRTISFGDAGENGVQVLGGLNIGEKLIISGLSTKLSDSKLKLKLIE